MHNAIFDMKMSTEATSLYILIDSLVKEGAPVTMDACDARWTTTCEDMEKALEELTARGVVYVDQKHIYVKDEDQWVKAD